ncbi:uncharacterized protein LOC125945424 [Dermacentor silvarum]|uniref:uncharacterized protein LOC125945424 n=1 Tax=Dermacentor silvarum TaxID=543639 RepID=UPI002101045D|nr:uncharacterized protein LOC125945424 [Dermacentor silvarum]
MSSSVFLGSRSPSMTSLSLLDDPARRRHEAKAFSHWKEVFASFLLLASFVMVLMFIIGWNKNMTSDPKSFRGSRQRGPFGLPETAPPQDQELAMEVTPRRMWRPHKAVKPSATLHCAAT